MFTAEQRSEIRNVIRSVFIDDPTEIQSIIQDWISGKTLEELGLLDAVFPVGWEVVQFPSADDNDPDVAFPASAAPTALYGGTWELQWNDEGICFYTEPNTGDTEQTRTNGLQEDQGQGHIHLATVNPGGTPGAGSYIQKTTVPGSNTAGVTIGNPYTDGSNGTPRTGSTTKGRNRLIRIWKRTA